MIADSYRDIINSKEYQGTYTEYEEHVDKIIIHSIGKLTCKFTKNPTVLNVNHHYIYIFEPDSAHDFQMFKLGMYSKFSSQYKERIEEVIQKDREHTFSVPIDPNDDFAKVLFDMTRDIQAVNPIISILNKNKGFKARLELVIDHKIDDDAELASPPENLRLELQSSLSLI